jgi:hypothetical protein
VVNDKLLALGIGISVGLNWIPFAQTTPFEDVFSAPLAERYKNLFGKSEFVSACRYRYPSFSMSEVENIYDYLMETYNTRGGLGLFSMVDSFSQSHLRMFGNELLCKQERFILWRKTIHEIGQVPFICAYLANLDVRRRYQREDFDDISPYLRTDNVRLRGILAEGIAENHYHLGASFPVFYTNWICLMNHISHRDKDFENLKEQLGNLSPPMQNKMDMYGYVRIAAAIRAFMWCLLNNRSNSKRINFWGMPFDFQRLINSASTFNSQSLDYTMYINPKDDRTYAAISGEICFLYKIFRAIYSGDKKIIEYADYLYAYMAIQSRMRCELVQANEAVGFANFKEYQDRKKYFISRFSPYLDASERMSFFSSIRAVNMKSFEVRIVPPNTENGLRKDVEKYMKYIKPLPGTDCEHCNEYDLLGKRCKRKLCDYREPLAFFVITIPKEADTFLSKGKNHLCIPYRHERYIKKTLNSYVRALIELRWKRPATAKHIHGIDACSDEIGCRPEVFAPSFRRVRETHPPKKRLFSDGVELPGLYITYHVGEDFLDLVDGLRAIDEAIKFLELRNGDRLGHALALGVSAPEYYLSKNHKIFMSRHDILDNAVWMYMMLQKRQIHLPDVLIELNQTYRLHYAHIYATEGGINSIIPTIERFYDAWKLRGDNPEHYRDYDIVSDSKKFEARVQRTKATGKESDFQSDGKRLRDEDCEARKLYHRYHYDYDVRKNGSEMYEWYITSRYVHATDLLQKEMQEIVATKGLGVECNPSSNVLIGTFKNYAKHPIFTFNNDGLDDGQDSALLQVSVNTDDQGVFDTDIENEYALLFCALSEMTDDHGRKKHKPHNIYKYIDNLRRMGIEQSFQRLNAAKLQCFGRRIL